MSNMIVGVKSNESDEIFADKLKELKELAKAIDFSVDYEMIQNMERVHEISYLGSGKLNELKDFVKKMNITCVIFNDELTVTQYNHVHEILDCSVLDRTSLILDIFERRAHTREAILQVEIAKLNYALPRLTGGHQDILGQQGGSGFRGSGETQLELDRRQLHARLVKLKQELSQVVKQRQKQRQKRQSTTIPKVSLVGYTNSGKSTLMNAFLKLNHQSNKTVFEKDMLFATLQTTTRLIAPYKKMPFLLTDTVGFIHYLPHVLIEAFKSTLEEVKEADLLLHVIDASNPYYQKHIDTTLQVLKEIGADEIPMLYVYNKVDLGGYAFIQTQEPHLFISAKKKINLDALYQYIRKTMFRHVKRVQLWLPYEKSQVMAELYRYGEIIEEKYQDKGIYIVAEILPETQKKIDQYEIKH